MKQSRRLIHGLVLASFLTQTIALPALATSVETQEEPQILSHLRNGIAAMEEAQAKGIAAHHLNSLKKSNTSPLYALQNGSVLTGQDFYQEYLRGYTPSGVLFNAASSFVGTLCLKGVYIAISSGFNTFVKWAFTSDPSSPIPEVQLEKIEKEIEEEEKAYENNPNEDTKKTLEGKLIEQKVVQTYLSGEYPTAKEREAVLKTGGADPKLIRERGMITVNGDCLPWVWGKKLVSAILWVPKFLVSGGWSLIGKIGRGAYAGASCVGAAISNFTAPITPGFVTATAGWIGEKWTGVSQWVERSLSEDSLEVKEVKTHVGGKKVTFTHFQDVEAGVTDMTGTQITYNIPIQREDTSRSLWNLSPLRLDLSPEACHYEAKAWGYMATNLVYGGSDNLGMSYINSFFPKLFSLLYLANCHFPQLPAEIPVEELKEGVSSKWHKPLERVASLYAGVKKVMSFPGLGTLLPRFVGEYAKSSVKSLKNLLGVKERVPASEEDEIHIYQTQERKMDDSYRVISGVSNGVSSALFSLFWRKMNLMGLISCVLESQGLGLLQLFVPHLGVPLLAKKESGWGLNVGGIASKGIYHKIFDKKEKMGFWDDIGVMCISTALEGVARVGWKLGSDLFINSAWTWWHENQRESMLMEEEQRLRETAAKIKYYKDILSLMEKGAAAEKAEETDEANDQKKAA